MSSRDRVTLEQVRKTLSGCTLSFSWFGVRKSFERDEKEETADGFGAEADAISASKRLVDTKMKEWKEITAVKTACRSYWLYNTLPCPVDGQRYFLIARRDEIFGEIVKFQDSLKEKTEALNAVRDEIIARAKKSLGKLFDERFYPNTFTGSFTVELREVSIDPPSYLMHTNAEEYQRQLQRGLNDLEQGMHRFEQQTLSSLAEATSRMINNLEAGSARPSNLEAFQKLFRRVTLMNFAGTAAFKSAMDDARSIIEEQDVSDLRKDGGIREEAKERLQKLLERHKALQEAVKGKVEQATA